MWGDPHISTPDGVKYTFNGWGQYWLLRCDGSLSLQGQTDLAWDGQGNPVQTATIFSAYAAQDAGPLSVNGSAVAARSSQVYVALNAARNGLCAWDTRMETFVYHVQPCVSNMLPVQ